MDSVYDLRPELRPLATSPPGIKPLVDTSTSLIAGKKRPRSSTTEPSMVPTVLPHSLSSGRKILVFGHHTHVLAEIEAALCRHVPPICCVRIDGATTPVQKQDRKNGMKECSI